MKRRMQNLGANRRRTTSETDSPRKEFQSLFLNGDVFAARYRNEGNTCYSSSGHAILVQSKQFQNFLNSQSESSNVVIQELQKDSSTLDSCSTRGVREKLGWMTQRQQDVHEYMLSMFQSLQSDNENAVKELVEMPMMDTWNCAYCSHDSTYKVENIPFLTLPVDNSSTLDECLIAGFHLQDFNKDRICQHCGIHGLKKKDVKIMHYPPLLMVHLNRFKTIQLPNGEQRKDKDNQNIDIPLYWKPSNDGNTPTYVLTAVSVHIGTNSFSGHYESVVINADKKVGYVLSDDKVRKKLNGPNEICHAVKQGYILVYEKVATETTAVFSPQKKSQRTENMSGRGDDVKNNIFQDDGNDNHDGTYSVFNLVNGLCKFNMQTVERSEMEKMYFQLTRVKISYQFSDNQMRQHVQNTILNVIQENKPDKLEELCKSYNIKLVVADEREEFIGKLLSKKIIYRADNVVAEQTRAILQKVKDLPPGLSLDGDEQHRLLVKSLIDIINSRVEDSGQRKNLLKHYHLSAYVKESGLMSSNKPIDISQGDFIEDICTRKFIFDAKAVTKDQAIFILEQMEALPTVRTTAKNIKKMAVRQMVEIIESKVSDQRERNDLMIHYNLDQINVTTDKKNPNLLHTVTNKIGNFLKTGGKRGQSAVPPVRVWDTESTDSIAKILEELKIMNRDDVLALHMQIKQRTEPNTRHVDKQLKDSIKEDLISKLVSKLDTKQQKGMLRKFNIEQSTNDDRIAGQLKMVAMNNEKLLKLFVNLILNERSKSDTMSVVTIADKINILQNLESMDKNQLESLHTLVCGKTFGNQGINRCINAIKKELCKSIVGNLDKEMMKTFIKKKTKRIHPDTISQLTNLVLKDNELQNELVTFFVEKEHLGGKKIDTGDNKQEDDGSKNESGGTTRGSTAKPKDGDANVSHMDESSVDGDGMDTNNTVDSCDEDQDQSTLASMSQSDDSEDERISNPSLSINEVRDLLEQGSVGQLERLTHAQMTIIYRKLNGKAKRVPNTANLVKFIKPRLISILLDFMLKRNANIAYSILDKNGLETASRKKKNKSLLQKAALQDGHERVLEMIMYLFEEMKKKKFVSDFQPHNLAEILDNMEKNAALREKRNELMRQGLFMVQPESAEPNLIVEAGKIAQKKIDNINFRSCKICTEKRLELKLIEKTGICERCTKLTPQDPTKPHTFSKENNMNPGPVPEALRDLNQLEQMAIAPNRAQMTLIRVRGGGQIRKGNAFCFEQDTQPLVDKVMMPHRPEDLPQINIHFPNSPTVFVANRIKLRRAIRWLFENNHHYRARVIISEENLALYPEDSVTPVENLRIIEARRGDNQQDEQDTADQEDGEEPDEHHGVEASLHESTVNMRLPVDGTAARIREAILQTGEEGQQQGIDVNFPARQGSRLVSEFNTPAFYTLQYPCLFPTGAGDITLARPGTTPSILEWFDHLVWLDIPGEPQNRFAKDTRFVFHISNKYVRDEGNKLAAIYADRVCKDMTLKDVQDAFKDPNHSLPKCMTLMTGQIPGTTGFFRAQRKKANSIERFVRTISDGKEQFNCFFTLSVADGHMQDLHRLLPNSSQYLDKIVVADLTEDMDPAVYISKKEDYRLRQANVVNNGHIVNDFVHRKLDIVREEILEKHYGMVDFIIRDEYQARTAIHFHVVARLVGLSKEDLDVGLKDYFFIEDMEDGVLSDEDRQSVINEHLRHGYTIVEKGKKEETLTKVQPARDRVIQYAVNTLGLNACFPEDDVEYWPPPHGPNHTPPPVNPLRESLLTVTEDPAQSLEEHYVNLCSRVQIHACRMGYCLKRRQNQPQEEVPKCRFDYPLRELGYAKGAENLDPVTGKSYYQRNRKPDCFEKGAEIHGKDLLLLRNLSNLVMHLTELLLVWGSNMDARLITNVKALISYILKYITKPEENSRGYEKMLQEIATIAGDEEGCTVRKLVQKLMMSTVKEHDVGR